MAKVRKRVVYLLSFGRRYLDGDGDVVDGWSEAINFGSEACARSFVEDNPVIAAKRPNIVSREFSDSDLMGFAKAYVLHMRLKKLRPNE